MTCSVCLKDKPYPDFYRGQVCRACARKQKRAYRRRMKAKARPVKTKLSTYDRPKPFNTHDRGPGPDSAEINLWRG